MRLLSKTSEVYMNFNQSFAQDNEENTELHMIIF